MSNATDLAIVLTAKDGVSSVLSGVTQKFGGLGAAGKLAAVGIGALSAGVGGILATLTASANKTAAYAGEVSKLKRELGLSAQEASKLSYAGQRLGLDTDELSKSFGVLAKDIHAGGEKLGDIGVKVARTKDGLPDFTATLGNLADKFKSMPDGVNKTALSMDLFGKSGKDMLPLLNQGKEGIVELGKKATELGLVLDENALGAAKRYKTAQKDIGDVMDGLKMKLGTAFLPVLADVAVAFMGFVNGVLPKVVAGVDAVRGGIGIATGVVKDLASALQGKMVGGGDFLAGIIGANAAADFMGLVTRVGQTIEWLWKNVVMPTFDWLKENAPPAWETVKKAIENAWTAAKPHLDNFIDKLEDMKAKFDGLPAPIKKWAETTAFAVGVVKVTGLDDTIMSWVSAFGAAASGAGGLVGALASLALGVVLSLAGLALLAAAVGAVVLLIMKWDTVVAGLQLELQTWGENMSALGTTTKATFEGWGAIFSAIGTAVNEAFVGILNGVIGLVGGAIEKLNILIAALNLIPGVRIPLIAKLELLAPNLPAVSSAIDWAARDRASTIYVNTVNTIEHRSLTGGADWPSLFVPTARLDPSQVEDRRAQEGPFIPPDYDDIQYDVDSGERGRSGRINIPVFHQGGVMPWDGLALLQRGERITPARAGGGAGAPLITINIGGDVDSRDRVEQLGREFYERYLDVGGKRL